MARLSLFLAKVFGFSLCFFLLWLAVGGYTLWLLGKIVTVPLTVFGFHPTGIEVTGKAIRFLSAVPGRTRICDVELAPLGFIVFLSLAFATAPVALRRRVTGVALGLLFLLGFHVFYLSVRVLLFSPDTSPQTLLVRFLAPAGILFPVVLWILLFPTDLFRFGRRSEAKFSRDVCPICGSRRDDVIAHVREAHGKGKKGLRSSAVRRYLELLGDEAPGDRSLR